MPKPTAHPSDEKLSAYNRGLLSPDEAVAIETHISDCEPCCETIVSLSSDDTFVGLLKEARQIPIDQTLAHDSQVARPTSFSGDIPPELAEHPRYEIVRLIGKGGMGDVYEAIHRKMERRVALKVINRQLFQKTEAVNRFHREVKTAAQLSHSNIVTAFDADQADDCHFMVMEYVDGVDLSQIVKDRRALPVADACDYIRQAATGLQHAHERGMVHRDIKPHNLMVTADGTIKILDFGLASLAPEAVPAPDAAAASSDLTAAGAIMGTPDFISPEQAEDARSVDIRSDIYSLGATLYYLLSGQVPFDDGSVMHKLNSHAQVEPAPLDSVRDDVPEDLVAIVSKMMAKVPDERYLTPSEVSQALESFLRTYRPDEAVSLRHEPSSGGNMSGSGGTTPGANDMSPDWIPVLGKWLFYMSLIPIVLLILDMFYLSDEASNAPDRTLFYIGTSVALSTIGGILAGIHQFNTGSRDNHREKKWPESQTMLIGLIILGAGTFYLLETDHGVVRIEVNDPSLHVSILGQAITMEDGDQKSLTITPGEWPLLVSKEDVGFRFHTDSFKIRRGDEITFKVEVDDDEIVVLKDGEPFDRREIFDLQRELQDVDESDSTSDDRTPADGNKLASVSTSTSKPELKVTGKTVNKGTAGLPSVYDWNFNGRDVGDLKVRLLLAQNGKSEVMQEFDFEELPAEVVNKVRLEVRDPMGADDQRTVSAILSIESPVDSHSTTINEDKGLSFTVEAPFSNRIERADLAPIDPDETDLLLAWSFWKGDLNHGRSMESMTEATADGNATFLFVTLDWKPIGEVALGLLQGDWETESLTESGKQLATENGFGGLLLQIKGNTFVIGERKPNGEKSEVNTGRIDINSTTSPRTIDFIGRDQPNQRSLGIYQLKDGVLRICLAEQGGIDAPSGKRIPDTKPLKRPTTFDSPSGSNIMLMEFRRTSNNTRKVETRRADVLGMGKVVSFVPQESDKLATIDLNKSERAVELWVSGDDAKLVQEGDRVRLEFEGWPAAEPADFFGGKVISLDPTADGAGMFRVLIKGDDSESWPDKRYLRPGVRANCWIFTAAQNPAQQSEARSSKPTVEEDASAPAGEVPAKVNDILNIHGTWQVTYSEDGGRIAPQEMLKELRFVIDEQNLTTEIGGRKSVSTYKLDPSTNPKSIDLTENGRTKQAIYDLVGDTLRICIAESGEQRPTAFDSQPGSANDLIIMLKRIHAPAKVDLPTQAISPDATSLTWVDVRALTREKADQALDSIITAASPEKQQRAQELIDPLRTQAQAGFAALEKGVEAGVEMFVSAEQPSPYVEAGDEFGDVDDPDALLEQISEAERGQLFVRMRPGTTPEAAITKMVAGLEPDSQETLAWKEIQATEFVDIGDGWFAAVGEDMLPLPPKQRALDVTPFVKAFENHHGAPIRFAWLMDDATRSEIDQTRPEADAILFGGLITTLRDMQSTTGGVWLGPKPKFVLDMQFANQEGAQKFKVALEELAGFNHLLNPFGSDDLDTPDEAQTMQKPPAAISLLFLDRDGAHLSKTFDIGLLQRLAAAGLPWPNLFEPGEPGEEGGNEDKKAVDHVEFRNGYVPGQVEPIENGHVYHLADGVFIKQKKDQSVLYYLVEDSVDKYELTDPGLKFKTKGKKSGSYFLPPAPEGFVAAWITLLADEGPEGTRFIIGDVKVAEFTANLRDSTKVLDLYKLRN